VYNEHYCPPPRPLTLPSSPSPCRRVDEYVQCMEPSVARCEPSRVYEYWRNKMTYTGAPYNCTPALATTHDVSPAAAKTYFPLSMDILNTGTVVTRSAGDVNYPSLITLLWLNILVLHVITELKL
jgi:hypothetical protein